MACRKPIGFPKLVEKSGIQFLDDALKSVAVAIVPTATKAQLGELVAHR